MGIIRPVFIADPAGVKTLDVEFEWEGLSEASVKNLHNAVLPSLMTNEFDTVNILEVSGYSPNHNDLGRGLSAFNLYSKRYPSISVESLYQGSKVFENGKQYEDLYGKSSLDAKRDKRLKTSGALVGFNFEGTTWGLNDHFYEWLYLSALLSGKNNTVAIGIHHYNIFTDICFGKNSFNCQAYAVAVYRSAILGGMDVDEWLLEKKWHINQKQTIISKTIDVINRTKLNGKDFDLNAMFRRNNDKPK